MCLRVKNPPANAGDSGSIPGWKELLEEEMAVHSSILAWRILWTEESGGLRSMGLQKSQTWQQLNIYTESYFSS